MTPAEQDQLCEAIGKVIGEERAETDAKIAALEAQVNALRRATEQFKFKGNWEAGPYKAGNFVSMGGAVFSCVADTMERPGTDKAWLLVVPRARDGRDGKDYATPEPRTVRSHR